MNKNERDPYEPEPSGLSCSFCNDGENAEWHGDELYCDECWADELNYGGGNDYQDRMAERRQMGLSN